MIKVILRSYYTNVDLAEVEFQEIPSVGHTIEIGPYLYHVFDAVLWVIGEDGVGHPVVFVTTIKEPGDG